MSEIVAFDLETTGLSPKKGHRVIEIGAVRVIDGRLGDEFHTLIDCKAGIPLSAQNVHGITPAMLAGQPAPDEAFAAFRAFIGRTTLVAHNASFDISFLRSEFDRLGWHLVNEALCTLQICRRRLPPMPDLRLETVARRLLDHKQWMSRRHRALDDARLVARIFLVLEYPHFRAKGKWIG